MNKKSSQIIIGISGGSGSGKTYIAKKLIGEYKKGFASLINQDSFYKDLSHLSFNKRAEQNFDDPSAIDFQLFIQAIKELRIGAQTEIPIYDFSKHTRVNGSHHINPTSIIIIDGTLIFSQPQLRDLMHIKIYIDSPDEIRLSRRIKRDINERGRTHDSIISQYSTSVRPMFDKYIAPTKKSADIVIDLSHNKTDPIVLIKNEIDKNLN